ncbi:MAG: hypothetical protein K8F91_25960 [Candidatus Obscuribacterales bacterium]|nr:hypothetical protein [Candidatus Obscuribacterales bacterium]
MNSGVLQGGKWILLVARNDERVFTEGPKVGKQRICILKRLIRKSMLQKIVNRVAASLERLLHGIVLAKQIPITLVHIVKIVVYKNFVLHHSVKSGIPINLPQISKPAMRKLHALHPIDPEC